MMITITILCLAVILPLSLLIIALCYAVYHFRLKARRVPRERRVYVRRDRGQQLLDNIIRVEPDEFGNRFSLYSFGFGTWVGSIMEKGPVAEQNKEAEVSTILKNLRYRATTPSEFFALLHNHRTRVDILRHLILYLIVDRTSLDNDPQLTLLPFTPETQVGLRAFYQFMHKQEFSKELMDPLTNVPASAADPEDDTHVKNGTYIAHQLADLVMLYADPKKCQNRGHSAVKSSIMAYLVEGAEIRMDMLGWYNMIDIELPIVTEDAFITVPQTYSVLDWDKNPLPSPRIWTKTQSLERNQDHYITVMGH